MPLLTVAATKMDTERMISNDNSPGSGSGQSHQEFAMMNSLARRKKQHPLPHPPPVPGPHGDIHSRPLPPLRDGDRDLPPREARPLPPIVGGDHSRPLPPLQVSDHARDQVQGRAAMYGITNQAFAPVRHDQSRYVAFKPLPLHL